MSTKELLKKRRADILRLTKRYGARDIRVFGSVARGEEGRESDIDFLVLLDSNVSLFDLVGLENALSELLGSKVDVVDERGLKPIVREHILHDAVPL
jgi:uncharacterized protein